MRVILNSNVLLVAIGRKSRYRPIWDAFISGKFEIGLSQDILSEYEEIINAHGAPGAFDLIASILEESPDVIFKHIYYQWHLITVDPDDNKFVDLAVACNADFIVTNDAHFKVLANVSFPSVKIVRLMSFRRCSVSRP